jgi:hypothetical protein
MSVAARAMLRVSIGYLLVIWGVDKLVNPAHGLAVSDRFYRGAFTFPGLMPVFGIVTSVKMISATCPQWARGSRHAGEPGGEES